MQALIIALSTWPSAEATVDDTASLGPWTHPAPPTSKSPKAKPAKCCKKIHKSFPDPAKAKGTETEIFSEYCNVRDSLKNFAMDFVEKELGITV